MSNHRRAATRDANESAIVEALRGVGAQIELLNGGTPGMPNLLVGFMGVNYLLEVKHPIGEKSVSTHSKRLTTDQELWHSNWNGAVCVVRTGEEALWAIGATRTPPCVQPNAPILKCYRCDGPVHTCERPEPWGTLSNYACPRHPDECEVEEGKWVCGKPGCWAKSRRMSAEARP